MFFKNRNGGGDGNCPRVLKGATYTSTFYRSFLYSLWMKKEQTTEKENDLIYLRRNAIHSMNYFSGTCSNEIVTSFLFHVAASHLALI